MPARVAPYPFRLECPKNEIVSLQERIRKLEAGSWPGATAVVIHSPDIHNTEKDFTHEIDIVIERSAALVKRSRHQIAHEIMLNPEWKFETDAIPHRCVYAILMYDSLPRSFWGTMENDMHKSTPCFSRVITAMHYLQVDISPLLARSPKNRSGGFDASRNVWRWDEHSGLKPTALDMRGCVRLASSLLCFVMALQLRVGCYGAASQEASLVISK